VSAQTGDEENKAYNVWMRRRFESTEDGKLSVRDAGRALFGCLDGENASFSRLPVNPNDLL
jgi:hypothetical protein